MAPTNLEKAAAEVLGQQASITLLEGLAVAGLDEIAVDLYLERLAAIEAEVMATFGKILATAPADMDPYNKDNIDMLGKIMALTINLRQQKKVHVQAAAAAAPPAPPPTARKPQVKLPTLELPHFNGTLSDWMSFRDLFTAAVHTNTELSNAQKLTYLRSSLTGDAAKLIKSMSSTDDNYDVAWAMLRKRYQNERELFFSFLKRFIAQPNLTAESADGLRSLLDVSHESFRALENLGVAVDQWDGILVFLMVQKLDPSSRRFWEMSLKDTSIPVMKDFDEFLEQQARALAAGGISKPATQPQNPPRKVNAHHGHHQGQQKYICKFCHANHCNHQCPKFIGMTNERRRDEVARLSLCPNCLQDGHKTPNCKNRGSCKTCGGRHHTLVHLDSSNATNQQPVIGLHTKSHISQTMLATAMVYIPDLHGQQQLCRVLLDGGSTASFITESCVKRLGLKRRRTDAEVTGLAAASVGTARGVVSIRIQPHFSDSRGTSHEVNALILPKVTGRLPLYPCDQTAWAHLQDLTLADPDFHQPAKIDVLLGADIFWDLLLDGKRKGTGAGAPIALRSTLGWLVAGSLAASSNQVIVHFADTDLDERLQRFWELKSLPPVRVLTKEEKLAEEHFQATTIRDETGRFIVELPFKSDGLTLGSSREIAVRRLHQLERRLNRNAEHRADYLKIMREYLALGHMTVIDPREVMSPVNPVCYIPHHFVLKESSTTTKFRVVFDGSAKTASGVSLNNRLMVGPTLQDTLISILMRFRTHVIAFTAEIAKMYRQVRLTDRETDMQRILWREDQSQPIREYKLLTVTYGTASAPYHAVKSLQRLAEEEEPEFPLASVVARRDFYVDDIMSGTNSIESALQLQSELLQLMKNGGFDLRKWSSNCPALLEALPVELRETQLPLNIDEDESIKTLGLRWNPATDQFSFRVHLPPVATKITKRTFLSEISKVFDPMGWLAPTVIRAKILMQTLWKLECGWDDPLPDQAREDWLTFQGNLHLIELIRIPRCIVPEDAESTRLFGFCDASEKAYAAVVYLRADIPDSVPVISLVASKTRVAPSKQISLPRLELCGAVLLSELMETVKNSLNIQITEIRAWSDSTTVLAWLDSHPSRWKTFVANRITQIQEVLPPECWAHVKGTDNPADCASRGLDPSELQHHPLWWTGPSWIRDKFPFYQNDSPLPPPADVSCEGKTVVIVNQANVHLPSSLLYKHSSLNMVNRVTAWCRRFIHNCRAAVQKSQPTSDLALKPSEIDEALLHWIRLTQSVEFNVEIRHLEEGRPLPPKCKLCALNPFLDTSRLLRVGGGLRHARLPADQRNPIILPRHHRMTELIITHAHLANFHAGAQLVQATLQRRYWIASAKDAIRHQIKKCVVCTRHGKPPLQQLMGDLPSFRVNPARPFLRTGVDYAGPFYLRAIPARSKVTYKAYMALFVCMTTRAIHLELVSSMTTAAFSSL